MRTLHWIALGVTALSAHSPALAQQVREQPVVYGNDDRAEVFEHPEEDLRNLAARSAVALVPRSAVDAEDPEGVVLRGPTLGESYDLCATERYVEQPSAAFCSGTLIGDDLVLTAGHCVEDQTACSNLMIAFNYFYESDGRLASMSVNDLFACKDIVVQQLDDSDGVTRDWAIVQLDRPATPRFEPVAVRTNNFDAAAGTELVMIGVPSGIPLKIDDGGQVRDPGAGDFFIATTDSFGGNSGSGVFDRASLELIGVLIQGDTDYVDGDGCTVVNVCAEDECGGENVLYAYNAIDDFCDSATSLDLCGTDATCGDGFCDAREADACGTDCEAGGCGDGVCSGDEWSTCEEDCYYVAPDDWVCAESSFGTGDGCNCECGAVDPDCVWTGGSSDDCGLFEYCDDTAVCVGGFGGDTFCGAVSGRRAEDALPGLFLLASAVMGASAGRVRRRHGVRR